MLEITKCGYWTILDKNVLGSISTENKTIFEFLIVFDGIYVILKSNYLYKSFTLVEE